MADMINIQVAYATPELQIVLDLSMPTGSTLQQALEVSALLPQYGIDMATGRFGIFGKPSKLDAVLRERDRVEVYRPLLADPKEVRKARAAEGKSMKKGGAGRKTPA
jgi:putative ubiquitin-RnfH superfamily antitoxin RatB of RatAB toxin-antitoxin module